ncbi:unnamed protein product [Diamesa tonsa]
MKVQFTVFKDNMTVLRATHNVCQKNKKKSEVLTMMMMFFGIPTKCPMEAGTFCQNDIKYLLTPAAKKMIGLGLGGVVAEAKLEHNDNMEFVAINHGITLYKTKMNGCDKPSTRTSDFSKIITLGLKTLNNCPIKPSIICENGSKITTIVAVKRFLAVIVGPLKMIANIDHGAEGKTCIEGKHVIRLTDNSTLTFDKNCDVTISGCIEIDAFSAGAAKYTIWKNHFQTSEGQFDVCDELKKYHLNANARHFLEHARIPRQCPVTKSEVCGSKNNVFKSNQRVIQNEINLCEKAKKADKNAKNIMRFLGLPEKCPVNATKICNTEPKKIDITKLAKFFPLAVGGPIRVETTLIHDTGKSCLMTEFEVTKIPKS